VKPRFLFRSARRAKDSSPTVRINLTNTKLEAADKLALRIADYFNAPPDSAERAIARDRVLLALENYHELRRTPG